MKSIDVVCVGNALVDVLGFVTEEQFAAAPGLVKGSMQLVNAKASRQLYPHLGQTTEMSGGSVANTAAGIASLGGRVAFFGRVAADEFGQVFTHDIRSTGVYFNPAPGSTTEANGVTGHSLVFVTEDGQRTMNTHLGVAIQLDRSDIDFELVAGAGILVVEGYLWDVPTAAAAAQAAIDVARSAGAKIALTLSDSFCVERHRDDFLALIENHVHIVLGDEDEVAALFESPRDKAVQQITEVCELAFVTQGAQGSLVLQQNQPPVPVNAVPVAQIVDTTGAGDAYAAGVLYGLTNGHDPVAAAKLGSRTATEVLGHMGARSLRPLAELLK